MRQGNSSSGHWHADTSDALALYHFTDESNLPSIRRLGLLSWKRLVAAGVAHKPASDGPSRGLDLRKGLEDYVCLATSDYHPMAYRAEKQRRVDRLIWLEVDERVLRFRPLFSDTNAAANNARINNDPLTAFESEDPQAEVLVRGFVALRWINFPAYSLQRGE